jgi:vacuolar-type H+-ATPase subunit B/Vma2
MFLLASRVRVPLAYCRGRAGLRYNEVEARIWRQAGLVDRSKVEGVANDHEDEDDIENAGAEEDFAVVLAAMSVNMEASRFFPEDFQQSGDKSNVCFFLKVISDSTSERIITRRLALTVVRYLTYACGELVFCHSHSNELVR